MTSLLPSRLTAMSSRVPQSETHKRPECHLGDSPNLRLVSRSCGLGLLPIVYSLLKRIFTHNTSIVSEFVSIEHNEHSQLEKRSNRAVGVFLFQLLPYPCYRSTD